MLHHQRTTHCAHFQAAAVPSTAAFSSQSCLIWISLIPDNAWLRWIGLAWPEGADAGNELIERERWCNDRALRCTDILDVLVAQCRRNSKCQRGCVGAWIFGEGDKLRNPLPAAFLNQSLITLSSPSWRNSQSHAAVCLCVCVLVFMGNYIKSAVLLFIFPLLSDNGTLE